MKLPPASLRLALIASLVVLIGCVGPWTVSETGTHYGVGRGGIATLLLALLALLLLIPRRPWPLLAVAAALLALGLTAVNVVDVAASTREPAGLEPPSAEVGWGLWLSLLGSLGLVVATFLFGRRVLRWPRLASLLPSTDSWVRRQPPLAGLAVLLGVGLLLRVWLTFAWSPAFTGYSDSGIYFQGAFESVWSDPIRMVGYPIFLTVLHAVSPHLILVTVVQHALGLVAAALFFFAVRRCGGSPWLGLAPAAVIALGGDELFLEHAALSDALFVFLLCATLYATVRASGDRLWWAAVAGLFGGLAVWDRTVGLGVIVVIVLWLAFSFGRPTRRTVTTAALALAVALAIVGVYAGWRSAAADMPGTLTSNNAWNLYARVAPWADCSDFTPPSGTRGLCQRTPHAARGYHSGEEYIYSAESPAQRLYGPPYLVSPAPKATQHLQEWSEAAILGQPGDYLNAVWLDTKRLFTPEAPSYGDLTADAFIAYLLYGVDRSGRNEYVESWQSRLYPDDPVPHHGDVRPFKTWEAVTRIVGFWMALLLALALAAPWLLRGRPRAGAILFGATALVLLFFPIVTKGYDYRFVVPAFAPLVATATLAASGVAERVRPWISSSTTRPQPSQGAEGRPRSLV